MKIIDNFSGSNKFLSNFYPVRIRYEGQEYPTLEHAYQAAKSAHPRVRLKIAQAATPGAAKRIGRKVLMDAKEWNQRKELVMLALLREKFLVDRLRRFLLNTGDAELVEGNEHGDRYWGVYRGEGKNRLGILLMLVREEIRARS